MNMNESTMTGLKIIVERAVRPVRVSNSRRRKIREELLSHVVGVFEEERARVDDDQAALERTALRFGNPAEVTSQLQHSVVGCWSSLARLVDGMGPSRLRPVREYPGGFLRGDRIEFGIGMRRASALPPGMGAPADRDVFVKEEVGTATVIDGQRPGES